MIVKLETSLKTGHIVKNLIPNEPVKIIDIQEAGEVLLIDYIGLHSRTSSNHALQKERIQELQVVSQDGTFTFDGNPQHFKIFAEAERVHAAYQFDPLFAVNCSLVDPLPHQIEAVYKFLLPQPKIRFLLADDTGAGKTIMAGLLLKEMILRGLIERILIVVPGGLTKQWQIDEMGMKFNLPFKLADRAAFNSDPSIFYSSPRLVTSLDFIRSEDVLNSLSSTRWDMVIVDEAHKLSAFEYGRKRYISKRYDAIHTLSKLCEHLLLLTATPHRGRKDTFKYLMQLLDEDIFASDNLVTDRVQELTKEGVNKFFIRRLKEEMRDWQENLLFKERQTRTVQYRLTDEEKKLYDAVTYYLTSKRKEAHDSANIHVSLALMVMQRRLTSSIYAIRRTLYNRFQALQGLLEELRKNPDLWKQRQKMDLGIDNPDDFDDLDDEEREGLETILSDPRKFKLFTTASSPKEIREEMEQVKDLYELADRLYSQQQEEQKYRKLRELLSSQGVLDQEEKLVLFTEHKDTLEYLNKRLTQNGYHVVTIHGGMNVDQRQEAQRQFASEAQILIATDAAGEGINLQFCRLMINWDIPWNPNRLEQRMGRIHRYGQKDDVIVFNLVAQNTREGKVLEKLLTKLDAIREQIGDDRVYDVISDLFDDVGLDEIVADYFDGDTSHYTDSIDTHVTEQQVRDRIAEQKKSLAHTKVDYAQAHLLKEHSDEKRLQPIYIRMFFEQAFNALGGRYKKETGDVFRVEHLPEQIAKELQQTYHFSSEVKKMRFCFDKDVFLKTQKKVSLGSLFYINPGNPLFDTLLTIVRQTYREEALKGTVLVSPTKSDSGYAFLVKSQLTDNRPTRQHQNIVDEQICLVMQGHDDEFRVTSPARIIDLHPPVNYELQVDSPEQVTQVQVRNWVFSNVTQPQLESAKERIHGDAIRRKEYLESAFRQVIVDLTAEMEGHQQQLLIGNNAGAEEKISDLRSRIDQLQQKRAERLENIDQMLTINPKAPEVIGCIYLVPLTEMQFKNHYGMSRDDEAEQIAMTTAMQYETDQGRAPEDVSAQNEGYDIRSTDENGLKRYIEVKGRSADGGVMISENEMNRLAQLGDTAWLYIVTHCKSKPHLSVIENPGNRLKFQVKSKGIQYFVPETEWKSKQENI
ncbi:helicase-related protein [Natronogracilivirga saccharolytica]|uniref:DUF3883 domain-containing protein n=1 Tax=Natronogracilivirga saccharolytica TaxID=2812953 RepID=A0A8J7RM69_9BACT|nr:helicase-related protein [Natronogracilivirga saccharolytica]MBP3193470.1 DUF3883 domain-containing protein [Natronogracilivirga saccharolytica]